MDLATDPISGARYALETDSGDVALWLQRAVNDISSQVVPRFASTGARDTAYSAAITAGTITSIANGMVCMANAVPYRRINGTWRINRNRNIGRTVINLGGGSTISSGGSNETGITGTIALSSPGANFTLYEAGTVSFYAAFRAGPGTGAAQCTIKINGTTVGNVAISRQDGTVPVVAIVALAAGTHSAALRVDAIAGSVVWVDGILNITEGIAE